MRLHLIAFLLICWCSIAKSQSDSIIKAKVDGITYRAFYKNKNETVSIIDSKGKTVCFFRPNGSAGISYLEFKDFNQDGYKDLIINYYTNVPDIFDAILYDKNSKKFTMIKGMQDYPAAIHLKGTNFYYSYHRSGCEDFNWDSDLFKIVNFKIVKIGNISDQTCVDPPDKPGIYITRITGMHKLLIKKFPISKIDSFKDDKWGFIAWYWKHNYNKFTVSN